MSDCTTFASALEDVALGTPPSAVLALHLASCGACTAKLRQQRALAERIDRALREDARSEPAPGLVERIAVRTAVRRSHRWNPRWVGASALAALAAAVVIVVAYRAPTATVHPADVAALAAWRSPTASLLISRTNVLAAPFTLRVQRDRSPRTRS